MRYFYHPESESLWAQPATDPIQDDGLTVELSAEEYEERQRARESKETKIAPTKPVKSVATSMAGGGLGLVPEVRETPTKQPLHVRARPKRLEEVIGQDTTVRALQRLIRDSAAPPHLYLFTGPSGCGKTTLGRIVASHVTASAPTEIDAATNGTVDDTRQLTDWAQYMQLDGSGKALIIDEAHALSKAAWQALLKLTEEPPAHLFIILCTTEPSKVPATIVTRAAAFALKPVSAATLMTYGEGLTAAEGIKLPENALRYIVAAADGSVRQLLMHLQVCDGAPSLAEVQQLLETSTEREEAVEIARQIVKGNHSYIALHPLLSKVKKDGAEPEGVRIAIVEYLTAVFLNGEKPKLNLIPFLDRLSTPVPARGGWAALACSICFACEDTTS